MIHYFCIPNEYLLCLFKYRNFGSHDLLEHTEDLTRLSMPTLHGFLGEDELIIDCNFECTATGSHQVDIINHVLVIG